MSEGPAVINQSVFIGVVSILILLANVSFIAGLVCGCLCHKHKQSVKKMAENCCVHSSQSSNEYQSSEDDSAYYNTPGTKQDPAELEMTENVAYGPLKHGRE